MPSFQNPMAVVWCREYGVVVQGNMVWSVRQAVMDGVSEVCATIDCV